MPDSADIVAGVELGGTKCVCVLGTPDGQILEQVRVPTTAPEPTLDAIARTLARWQDATGFSRLGVASFGPIDLDSVSPTWGAILSTPKPGWSDIDVARRLRDRFAVPTAFETDVVGAGLAEGRWGAARGLADYAYITVGTGVGAGIIAHGRPLGGFGHAELGHVRVGRSRGDTWPGACPYHGDCVEGLASGTAIAARTGRSAEALDARDPVWGYVADALAGMLQTLILTAAPRLILLGGGVMQGNPGLLDTVRARLPDLLGGYVRAGVLERLDAYLRAPALEAEAGPLGALAVALRAPTTPPMV